MTTVCVLLLHHRLNKTHPQLQNSYTCQHFNIFSCQNRHSLALPTSHNNTIHWRSGDDRISIIDEKNNRIQRKWKYCKVNQWARIAIL